MSNTKYTITLYMADDRGNPFEQLTSSTPYLSIHAGDFMFMRDLARPEQSAPSFPEKLRVVEVEHWISGLEELDSHELLVFLAPT